MFTTVKVYREDAGSVLYYLVLVPAVLVLQVNTLEVILSRYLNILTFKISLKITKRLAETKVLKIIHVNYWINHLIP